MQPEPMTDVQIRNVWHSMTNHQMENIHEVAETFIAARDAMWKEMLLKQKPAFYGFMSEDECCVNLCFTPHAPRGNGEYATAYYTAPMLDGQNPVAWLVKWDDDGEERVTVRITKPSGDWSPDRCLPLYTALAATEKQEPVAEVDVRNGKGWVNFDKFSTMPNGKHSLYTTPVDAQIEINQLRDALKRIDLHVRVARPYVGRVEYLAEIARAALGEQK